MSIDAFVAALIATLEKVIPGDAADRQAGLSMAREMLEAARPSDPEQAAATIRAIAAHFAAMDAFARAAKPGVGDAEAVRLRNNAIAAARLCETLSRERRQPGQRRPAEKPSLPPTLAQIAEMAGLRTRRRAEPPSRVPGIARAPAPPIARSAWREGTALSPVLPTVPVPA